MCECYKSGIVVGDGYDLASTLYKYEWRKSDLFGQECDESNANCLVKQFAILLLNVMEVFSVGGGALLDIPCMVFQ